MTVAQQKEFGADKWTAKQRHDFEMWTADYATKVSNALIAAASKRD